jgi:outer membrane protein OmpA-like peptidoglycan-associated protein
VSGPADKVAQPYTPTATPRKPDAKPDTPRKAQVELGKGPFAGSPTAAPLAASPPSAPPIARPPGPSRLLDRFAFDSDAPTASHLKQIDAFAGEIAREAQKGGRPIKIVVTGHTDTSGKETYNEGLGLRRAEKTKAVIEAALRKAGVGPTAIDSIEVLSAGEKTPIVETPDEKREARNRAVEVATSLPIKAAPIPTAPPEPDKKPLDLFKIPPSALPPLAERPSNPHFPDVPGPSREWLQDYLRNDAILHKLPKGLRDQLITPLKDLDEITANQIIDALPLPADKKAVKAAVDSLLRVLKGRKPKMPEPSPFGPDMPPELQPQQMPGQKMLQSPKLPLPYPFN